MSEQIQRVYGWHNSRPDHRDVKYTPRVQAEVLPASYDLRPKYPTPYDQLDLGSCTGNSIAGAIQYKRREAGKPDWTPSRLGIYFGERSMEGTVGQDAGAAIRDGMKVVNNQGTAPETLWPYNTKQFTVKPPKIYYATAAKNKVIQYEAVDNTNLVACKSAIYDHGNLILGFTVYESFESDTVAKTGVAPLPTKSESVLGGHAVCAVGFLDDASQYYDTSVGAFIVRNSWNTTWGMSGYFLLRYDYVTNPDLADDFWVISSIQ